MRLLNKIAVGASAFAFAAALTAGVVASPAPVALAADSPSSVAELNVTFNLYESKAKITTNDNKVVVSYPTVNGKGELSADKNVCTYDVEDQGVLVDLSTLNPTKDNYIKISGDINSDPVVYKIPASLQLKKGTASATDGAISVTKKDGSDMKEVEKLEYATTSSNWAGFWDMKFSQYMQLGATIRVRVAGTKEVSFKNDATIKDKTTEYTLKEVVGNLPGKEIKAKIPKMANAPKAKVDYAKRIITIAKGCEYRINNSNNMGSWSDKLSDKKELTAPTIDLTQAGNIDVRKAATETKPASKYSVTSWKGIYQFAVQKTADMAASLVVTQPAVKAVSGGAVTIKYVVTDKTARVATKSTITIANNASDAKYTYQCKTVDKGAAAPALGEKSGVKSIAKKKSVDIKFTCDNKFKESDIYVRRAAVTKGDVAWVTEWVKVATVDKNGTVTFAATYDKDGKEIK